MIDQMKISSYCISWEKRFFDFIFAATLLIVLLPLLVIVFLIVIVTAGCPGIFVQDRMGKDGKIFRMYKFRTMRVGSEKEQIRFIKLNEVDGPVFKIRNDPRFVGLGKWLSHSGLDELPQLVNVLKGEMSLVGPRPLPVKEFRKVPKLYQCRQMINPGVCSQWQLVRSGRSKFKEWMKLDAEYLGTASFGKDCMIILKTVKGLLSFTIKG